ncbi:FliH/SctL family protein [Oceanicoccus sp. KOV_DT_Chl]|uniref:FliH/SctL family protein n=1 Tax=Oceanicoccus sp. KOV_DT_Chl TaxID=1904639 RepID=UPI000C7A56DD|nr:FliH/SctL family protein [Oceanicoccus sp. KOV_DT_Chl]
MTRIPSNQSSAYGAWQIPEVKDGQIVKVEKLQNRGPRGELINVDKNEVIYSSITAAQLEEISSQAYNDVSEQARKEGYQKGHAEGHQAGMQAASQTVKKQSQGLQAAVAEIYNFLAGQDDEVEQALMNVATCIASAVLRRELTIDSSQILQIVTEAVAMLPMDASNITVFLSEQDHKLLTAEPDEIPSNWQLQVKRNLTPGGCQVRSQYSVVDFTLEEQFQQAVNEIVERRYAELAQAAKQRLGSADDEA